MDKQKTGNTTYRFDGFGVLKSYKYRMIWIERLNINGEPTEDYSKISAQEYKFLLANGRIQR